MKTASYQQNYWEKKKFYSTYEILSFSKYLNIFQSGFRSHHSTETALVKALNDIRFNLYSGKGSVFVVLELTAAFDTVDHNILI